MLLFKKCLCDTFVHYRKMLSHTDLVSVVRVVWVVSLAKNTMILCSQFCFFLFYIEMFVFEVQFISKTVRDKFNIKGQHESL